MQGISWHVVVDHSHSFQMKTSGTEMLGMFMLHLCSLIHFTSDPSLSALCTPMPKKTPEAFNPAFNNSSVNNNRKRTRGPLGLEPGTNHYDVHTDYLAPRSPVPHHKIHTYRCITLRPVGQRIPIDTCSGTTPLIYRRVRAQRRGGVLGYVAGVLILSYPETQYVDVYL